MKYLAIIAFLALTACNSGKLYTTEVVFSDGSRDTLTVEGEPRVSQDGELWADEGMASERYSLKKIDYISILKVE